MKYEVNETMKMLGKQIPSDIISPESFDQIKEVIAGNNLLVFKPYLTGLCMDVFTLGFIKGKRAERERKSESKNNELIQILNRLDENKLLLISELAKRLQ